MKKPSERVEELARIDGEKLGLTPVHNCYTKAIVQYLDETHQELKEEKLACGCLKNSCTCDPMRHHPPVCCKECPALHSHPQNVSCTACPEKKLCWLENCTHVHTDKMLPAPCLESCHEPVTKKERVKELLRKWYIIGSLDGNMEANNRYYNITTAKVDNAEIDEEMSKDLLDIK